MAIKTTVTQYQYKFGFITRNVADLFHIYIVPVNQ